VKCDGNSVVLTLCAKLCVNMCNNDRVMAVKVKFKMAAAAILDFMGSEF